MKTNYMVEIAYDGLNFSGFAIQPNKRTVEGEINKYLSEIYGEEVKIIKSSRTDSGVHALEYNFIFKSSSERRFLQVKKFIQERIPDLRWNKMWIIDDKFHPRHDAITRTYIYKLYTVDNFEATKMRNYHLGYFIPINKTLMKELAKRIKGEHDFASFTAKEKYDTTVRTVTKVEFQEEKKQNYFVIKVTGTGFLMWMVRNIVGAMLAVNSEKITIEQFQDLLDNPKIGKSQFKVSPTGLYKFKTIYKKESLKGRKIVK